MWSFITIFKGFIVPPGDKEGGEKRKKERRKERPKLSLLMARDRSITKDERKSIVKSPPQSQHRRQLML